MVRDNKFNFYLFKAGNDNQLVWFQTIYKTKIINIWRGFFPRLDILEEGFNHGMMLAWLNRGTITTEYHLVGFIISVVKNYALREYQKDVSKKKYFDFLNQSSLSISTPFNIYESSQYIDAALNHLTLTYPGIAKVMVHAYIYGLDTKEIAQETGFSYHTIRQYRLEGVKKLQDWLQNESKNIADWYTKTIITSKLPKRIKCGYQEAKDFAHKHEIKSRTEWLKLYSEGKLPKEMPGYPSQQYKSDYEGHDIFYYDPSRVRRVSFIELQDIVQKAGITSRIHYYQFYETVKGAPKNPQTAYISEWPGWLKFLGKENPERIRCGYLEAKAYARKHNIKSKDEWLKLYSAGKLPKEMPGLPDRQYKSEYEGPKIFYNTQWLPFIELQRIAQKAKITSRTQYRKCYNTIEGAPKTPENVYINDWPGWVVFLGKEK